MQWESWDRSDEEGVSFGDKGLYLFSYTRHDLMFTT